MEVVFNQTVPVFGLGFSFSSGTALYGCDYRFDSDGPPSVAQVVIVSVVTGLRLIEVGSFYRMREKHQVRLPSSDGE